jgi:hypothetical protein
MSEKENTTIPNYLLRENTLYHSTIPNYLLRENTLYHSKLPLERKHSVVSQQVPVEKQQPQTNPRKETPRERKKNLYSSPSSLVYVYCKEN